MPAARSVADVHSRAPLAEVFSGAVRGSPAAGLLPRPGNLAGQLAPAAADPRFHRAYRQRQAPGDLVVRELLHVAQDHRFAEHGRHLPQRAGAAARAGRRAGGVRNGVRAGCGGREVGHVHPPVEGLALLANTPVVVDAEVAGDADEPGLEVRPPVERAQGLEHLQKDFLGQVLRLLVPSHELVRHVEDLVPVPSHDQVPRSLVAAETGRDQLVRGRRRWRGDAGHPAASVRHVLDCVHALHVQCARFAHQNRDGRDGEVPWLIRRSLSRGRPAPGRFARRDRPARGHARVRLPGGGDRGTLRCVRGGVRRLSPPGALRPEGELDAGRRPPRAVAGRGRGRQLGRRDRRRPAGRFSRRATSSSPAWARPRPSWRRRSRSSCTPSTRRARESSSASTGWRGRAACARGWRCG